jgi:predicted permease
VAEGRAAGDGRPPRLPRVLLRVLLPRRHREFVIGDLDEEFAARSGTAEGVRAARRKYWRLSMASIAACLTTRAPRPPRPHYPGRDSVMTSMWRDIVYGARLLRRRPGFTGVAVLTLALGIGATTAVFSVGNWLLLRPLPGAASPEELITIEFGTGGRTTGISTLNLEDLRAGATALAALGGYQVQSLQVMTPAGTPAQLFGESVGGEYFEVLGVRPVLGRMLRPEESAPGQPTHVAVISTSLWRTLFGADPGVIGRILHVNRIPLTVVGVAPADFRGAEREGRTDVWYPISIYAEVRHFGDPTMLATRRAGVMHGTIGRLARGTTVAAAQVQIAQIMQRLVTAYPEDNELYAEEYAPRVFRGVGLSSLARDYLERTVRLLFAAVALVLVIACANVANMLLFRSIGRRGEAAVRRTLGATTGRLLRQQLAESLMLALAGGAAGVAVAFGFRKLFEGSTFWRHDLGQTPFDARVFAFVALASVATALLFSIVPTVLAGRFDLMKRLSGASARTSGRTAFVRRVMTVVQLALSLALLVGAGLLARTLFNLNAVELGFDAHRVFSFLVDTGPQGYDDERRAVFERALLDRLRAEPGIQAAALSVNAPFTVSAWSAVHRAETPDERVRVVMDWISPGYFDVLGNRLLDGREFSTQDRATAAGPASAIVSETLARQLFGDRPAVGRTMLMPQYRSDPRELRIIGVVADKRVTTVKEQPEAIVYEPLDAEGRIGDWSSVLVRSPLSLAAAEAAVRRAVDALDPALPITGAEPLSAKVERSFGEQQMFARLLVALATIALLMAAVGLYGVISYSVAERTREIGIRMALGARRERIFALVMREAGAFAAVGILLGVLGAVALSRALESRLFGVRAFDPATYASAALIFAALALTAAAVPTRAAIRVDPVSALRRD